MGESLEGASPSASVSGCLKSKVAKLRRCRVAMATVCCETRERKESVTNRLTLSQSIGDEEQGRGSDSAPHWFSAGSEPIRGHTGNT